MPYTVTFDYISKPCILRALPPGISFKPSESDLVAHYLCGKIDGKLDPLEEAFVPTCDIYGEEDPWQIWERLGGGDDAALHLFTKLKKKSVNGKRSNRTVGASKGTWHGEGGKQLSHVDVGENIVTWQRRRFNYKNPKSPHHHGCWIMFEYSCSLSTDLVLVVLKRNNPCVDDDDATTDDAAPNYTKPKQPKKSKVCKVDDGKQHNSHQSEISAPKSPKVAVFKRKNPCVDAPPAVATQETQSKKRKTCKISYTLDDQGKQKKADQPENSGPGIWENQVAAADISDKFDDEFAAESLATLLLSFDGSDSLVGFDCASITQHMGIAGATDDGSIQEGLDMLNDGFSSQSFTNMMDPAIGFDSAMVTGCTNVDGSSQEAYDGRSFGKWITVEAGCSDWA